MSYHLSTIEAAVEVPHGKNEKKSYPPPSESDPFLITFDLLHDEKNPLNWPLRRKVAVTFIISATGFTRIAVSTIVAPALPAMTKTLSLTPVEAAMSLSIYLLATAFGPLLIGPLSEAYGRSVMLHASNVVFLVWNIVCGFAESKAVLITARCLGGMGAGAVYSLASGVLGDVWPAEQRGRSIGLYVLIPLAGSAAGPIAGGYITEATSWRWIFWSTSVLQGLLVIMSVLVFRETYAPVILRRIAKEKRESTGNLQYCSREERLYAEKSTSRRLLQHLSRPLRLLIFHPIVQAQACYSAFNYGILYIVLSTFAFVWTNKYYYSVSVGGLHYLALFLGELAGAIIGSPLTDAAFLRLTQRASGVPKPEFRVPLMVPGALITPVGLFLYGWFVERHMHYAAVDTGAAALAFGMQVGDAAMLAYVIDSYPEHASSATAASQVVRSLAAFSFPLFAPTMYEHLGYGGGNSLLAGLALVIGVPTPILLWKYGSVLRAKGQSSD